MAVFIGLPDGFISIIAFDFHNFVIEVLTPFFNLGNKISGSYNNIPILSHNW